MGKTLIIAALAGISMLTSCSENDAAAFKIFSQIGGAMSNETVVLIGVTEVIKNHPESLDTLKKVGEQFRLLSTKDSLTKTDIQSHIEEAVLKSGIKSKAEVLVAVKALIGDVFKEELIDLSVHKQTLIDFANGIDEAIRIYYLSNDKVVSEGK